MTGDPLLPMDPTPPPPESWLLVEAVAERLRAILIDAGYHTDAGTNVITEHAQIDDASAAPQLLVFLDGELRTAASSSRKWRDRVAPITVQCRFPLKLPTAQHRAHQVMADLDRAIPADAPQLTDDEWAIQQEALSILQRPTGADTVVVQLELSVSHRVYTPTPKT